MHQIRDNLDRRDKQPAADQKYPISQVGWDREEKSPEPTQCIGPPGHIPALIPIDTELDLALNHHRITERFGLEGPLEIILAQPIRCGCTEQPRTVPCANRVR